jgi:hypothetical protein
MQMPAGKKWFDIVPIAENKLTALKYRKKYHREVRLQLGLALPSTFLLEENTVTLPFYITLPKYLPFARVFLSEIDKMITSGLVQKWHDEYFMVDKNFKNYKEDVDPKVLDLEPLRFGFIAYAIILVLSVLVFVVERMICKAKMIFSTIFAFYIIKACPFEKFMQ